jgi:hypothetical protein
MENTTMLLNEQMLKIYRERQEEFERKQREWRAQYEKSQQDQLESVVWISMISFLASTLLAIVLFR